MRQYLFHTLGLALGTLALAGCGINNLFNSTASAKPHYGNRTVHGRNMPAHSPATSLNPPLTIPWILPSHLPQSALASHPWPLYGSSSLNQFPASWHGQDSFRRRATITFMIGVVA